MNNAGRKDQTTTTSRGGAMLMLPSCHWSGTDRRKQSKRLGILGRATSPTAIHLHKLSLRYQTGSGEAGRVSEDVNDDAKKGGGIFPAPFFIRHPATVVPRQRGAGSSRMRTPGWQALRPPTSKRHNLLTFPSAIVLPLASAASWSLSTPAPCLFSTLSFFGHPLARCDLQKVPSIPY